MQSSDSASQIALSVAERLFLAALSIALFLTLVGPISADTELGIRAEGYIGYATLDFDAGLFGDVDEDSFQGGGSGSIAFVSDRFYFQADVFGDAVDYDSAVEIDNVGGGGHLGFRSSETGRFGVAGAYNRQEVASSTTFEYWRAGLEAEVFLESWTLNANGGYLDLEDDSSSHLDFAASYYATDNARLSAGGGLVALEESDPVGIVRIAGEFLFVDPLAAFVRWEGSFLDANALTLDTNSIVAGISIYFDSPGESLSLKDYDRRYFKNACLGYQLFGRVC